MVNESIKQFFFNIPTRIEDNPDIREPQKMGYLATRDHFLTNHDHAILQIPVGCGKTGLMSILPFGIARGRVLIIAPNLEIREGIRRSLDISSPDCFWKKTGVLRDFSMGPFVAVLDGPNANIDDCRKSHIVVTNIQQLASSADRWMSQFEDDLFDMILIDEGHHNVAPSWQKVFERFPNAKVVSLTATPVRGDGQPIAGALIYRYPFRTAMIRGYIKQIKSVNVAPSEIYFTYKGDIQRHTLQEVLQLREEDWFSKGVALARECNISVVDASIQWMNVLRETGTKHQIIAVACSIDHAREIRSLYEERGVTAREIHSRMPAEDREEILRELRNSRLDCIVQVRALGEGFDHPSLSVAAIFNPFRSLSPYIQFVGRIMRVIHQNSPNHLDNEGVIVSHVGLNMDKHWDDFKSFDEEDQSVVREWLSAEDIEPDEDELERRAGKRRRMASDMVVMGEIIDSFLTQDFIDPADEAVIDDLLAAFRERGLEPELLGITREDLRRRLLSSRRHSELMPESISVTPQRQRQQRRKRLNEQCKSLSMRILAAMKLPMNSPQLIKLFPGMGATNNFAVVIMLVNKEIGSFLGGHDITREELSIEQIDEAISQLDAIGDKVEAIIRERYGQGH